MKSVKKKICLVIPSLQLGGMERVMSELANYFSTQNKYEVHLILYGLKRDIFYKISNNIIIHKPKFEFDNSKRTWYTLKTLWFLRKKVKKIHPDTVLSFGELWNNFVLLAMLGSLVPVYVSDRCQPNKSLGRIHDFLRSWLYPKSSGIICQTEMAKKIILKSFHHENICVIGNPIRQIVSNCEVIKENIVLSVGRLIQTKHFDELIQMFSEIYNPEWKLVIVGDDALKQKNKEQLEQLINNLGMAERIILAGKRNDVDLFFNKAKIFAFTSSSEGFPNVIGEAMSAGLPVVAYNCVSGPSDLIEHNRTGYLISLHDQVDFKNKLKNLMDNEELRERFGINAKESIKRFSSTVIFKKFEKFILNESSSN
jgi:glycosyltransferase involved in cell wall biosynthesis